jgi:hypothetical protein
MARHQNVVHFIQFRTGHLTSAKFLNATRGSRPRERDVQGDAPDAADI